MSRKGRKCFSLVLYALIAIAMILSACTPAATPVATQAPAVEPTSPPAATAATGALESEKAAVAMQFFDAAEMEQDIKFRTDNVQPMGPEGRPWEQFLIDNPVDTTQYAKEGPYTICFSNAGVNNPWRVVGFTTMQAEVDLHPDEIEEFIHVDAEGSDEKQISDIEDLVASGNCDVLIVSPNTTTALTPAVEAACNVLPVIVFDRGVQTDCPVSFIRPIGGYLFGYDGATFIKENLPNGGNVLALRILPGVDVLEQRWASAKAEFENSNLTVIGVEFGEGDNTVVKGIVNDYLDRFGKIDAIWMDAGATAVAAIEAFEDAGQPYPIMVGEDQQDYLQKWKDQGLTAIAPTFPTYQWRTPIIAALQIMRGEPVQKKWTLPQPAITGENLDTYLQPNMPPLHYALCGCEDMPDFPERWGGR